MFARNGFSVRNSLQFVYYYFFLPYKDRRIIRRMDPLLGLRECLYLYIDLKGKTFLYDSRDLCGYEIFE